MEVIIVDQSRGDTTSSIIETRRTRGLPIIYVRQQACGLAGSQNAAIARARCPIIAVLDDDCVPERGWIAVIEKSFASCKTLAALTGRVLPLEPDGDKIYPVSSRISTVRTDFTHKRSPWIVGSGNNFAVKREWFLNIGGCDERLGPGSVGKGGVDMDLFYRLLRVGGYVRYEPDMLVYHERQTKAGRIGRRSMYGRGMGACCTIWLRQRDLYALRVLAEWIFYRTRLFAAAILRCRWLSAYEELLMLIGTVRGLMYGVSVGSSAKDKSDI